VRILRDKDAQTIMKQVIKTYKELYDLGIVHRDLKLSNLLVKNNQVKLADFGFAVPIVNCIEEFPYNAGSPFFMSPEALKRNRFSFESDIWALGVMAYELVFGKLPYQEKVESLQYETIMKSNIEEKLRGVPLSETYKHFITSCM
jgi:serine/threonine-protein kinase ULK/ATG1